MSAPDARTGAPADDTQPADGTPPADDTRPADGTPPADDTRPADGTPPADDTRPADGTPPADDTRPADGTPPADDTWPADAASAAAPPPLPAGFLARARELRRRSDKPDDFLWARLTARAPAAWLLSACHRLPLTPNGWSLVSLALGLASAAAYAVAPGTAGLWWAFALGQLAFVVDCVDGMAARALGLRSPAGTALDFLVDALKQIALFPAVAWRVWTAAGQPLTGVEAWPLAALVLSGPLVAASLALTTFLRSPEVTGRSTRAHRDAHDRSPRGRVLALLSFLLNYPSWILVPVALDRMDLFLAVSLPLYALHAGWSLWLLMRRVCGWSHYGR